MRLATGCVADVDVDGGMDVDMDVDGDLARTDGLGKWGSEVMVMGFSRLQCARQ